MTASPRTDRPLPRRTPASAGIPASALAAVADRLESAGLDPHALLITRGGGVVFEASWAPYRIDRVAQVYSATKTYTALAIGYLADEGRVGLDDEAGAHLSLPNPHGLTIRHLLTMNTGHTGAQLGEIGHDPQALLGTAPAHTPGTYFAYNSPASHTLSALTTAVTGESLTAYLRPRLLDPLGIGERWMRSIGDIEQGSAGYHLSVEDLARTGIALGADGVVDGVQVVPAWFVTEMTHPWSDTSVFDGPPALPGAANDWGLGYGYQLWRGRHGFRLDGAAGQFALVVPELDLVIAYQGSTLQTHAVLGVFWDFIEGLNAAVDVAGSASVNLDDDLDLDDDAAAPAGERDTWDARELLEIMPGVPYDLEGLRLDDTDQGWQLVLPGVGVLPIATQWQEVLVDAAGDQQAEPTTTAAADAENDDSPCSSHAAPEWLRVATRGERRADGSVLVHVVDTTSPHRVIVERAAGGALRAGWHMPPMGDGWNALRVPRAVAQA